MFKAKKYQNPSCKKAEPTACGTDKNPALQVPAHHIIAIASGKGGVGKSTLAANIAVAMAYNHDLKVGLLDADIYGPSQPLMMGNTDYKPELDENKKLIPAQCHGVKMMSIGFMADPDKALIWRGPMAQSAFYQMARDVAWAKEGEKLDLLIIDLPPGTGDVQLTMIKKLTLSGAVIVSTPQDIALIDARRAAAMFTRMEIPVFGLIENMSTYICPKCGHEEHIFGKEGVRIEAEKTGVAYLGDIPLSRTLREKSDQGKPVALDDEKNSYAEKINDITSKIYATLETRNNST